MDPFLIGGLVFTTLTVASLLGLHIGKVVVPRVGRWKAAPKVYVSASSPVTLREVREAVDWLDNAGFKFGAVESTDRTSGPVPGAIFVGLPDEVWVISAAGQAEWLVKHPIRDDELEVPAGEQMSRADEIIGNIRGGIISEAIIGIRNDIAAKDVQLVIRHELLHCLGYLHCETALLGRKKRDGKKRAKGDAKLGIVGRKTGHLMHPYLSQCGDDLSGIVK